jgi:hypothetical protein
MFLACIGFLIVVVLLSYAIANRYGAIAFPSLLILWLGSAAVAGIAIGYLPKHAEQAAPPAAAQPAAAKTPAK